MNEKKDIELLLETSNILREYLQSFFRVINTLDWSIFEQEDLAEYEDEADNGLFNLIYMLEEKLKEMKEDE